MTHPIKALIGACICALLMSACSPMNTEFSCNATAGDSCMTIEQVDAMTRYADGNGGRPPHHAPLRKAELTYKK